MGEWIRRLTLTLAGCSSAGAAELAHVVDLTPEVLVDVQFEAKIRAILAVLPPIASWEVNNVV